MNDTDLAEAYKRLADAATPPTDASDRVDARITQRRRRRASGTAALAVALVLGLGAVAAGLDDEAPGEGRDPAAPPAPTSAARDPLQVTCADGQEPSMAFLDAMDYATFTGLIAYSAERGPIHVDRDARLVFRLRPDGSAYSALGWSRGDGRWQPGPVIKCGMESRRDIDPAKGAKPLSLDLGHCWIDPVEFEGGLWDVMAEDQIDSGAGEVPPGFRRSGVAWRAGDVVIYRDDSGTLLTLVPRGDPWAMDRPSGCR